LGAIRAKRKAYGGLFPIYNRGDTLKKIRMCNDKMKTKLIAGILALALVATAIGVVSARNNFSGLAQTSTLDE